MADNELITVGTDQGAGTSTVAMDDIGGVKFQRVKLVHGADGVNAGDVASGNPLPVSAVQSGAWTVSGSGTFTVAGSGNFTVVNAGTFAIQDSEKVVDNAAFTDGTTKVQPAGFIFDEVAGTALTENDAAAARIDSKRAQVAVIEDETTRGRRVTVTAANALKVDGSAVTQPVSITGNQAVNVAQINGVAPLMGAGATGTGSHRVTIATDGQGQLVDNAAFTDGTTRVDMAGFIFDEVAGTALTENDAAAARINANRAVVASIEDGATRARYATVTAANALKTDGSAVTQPVSGTVTANLAAGTNTNEVVGDVAQDAAIAGNPLSVGLRASIATPAAMSADGDSVYAWGDLSGGLFTRQRPAATSTLSNVASSGTSVTLLAANTARIEAFIMNDSTAALMVKLGGTASATSYTKRLAAGEFWAVPQSYRGVIDGIWQAVQGNARVTELTS